MVVNLKEVDGKVDWIYRLHSSVSELVALDMCHIDITCKLSRGTSWWQLIHVGRHTVS